MAFHDDDISLDDDPLWYKDAIIYELHVKAFHDGSSHGNGDFKGLTQKLDYLADLGVTTIWLLPFYPSPLKDDGYDIADYTSIHEKYGVLEDFDEFITEAHARGLRVITELVINHTSTAHPWFQRARKAPPDSVERDFYVWSDTPDKFQDARIIFKDFETSNWAWDPVAKAYYWHRFYSHQPDLNYDNPAVWRALFPLLDFWLDKGVDGVRLDAIPYLYEREGTNCENLPETHVFLKALRKHVDQKYRNRMFLAEANQWPEDSVAYFGDGDECHTAFHFPLMPRMFMAIRTEDRFPIIDILAQTPDIPEHCQWVLFLRNHDELTLEMVTEEERDYMYRAYAQDPQARINLGIRRRLAPLMANNRRRIELMNGLLFALPGTPVIYYGDEIGMGDNIYLGDRDGVRTPMQWSGDRNAGFSRCNPQKLFLPVIIDPEYHYESINVEAQQNNPSSLLWWMKRIIALRKRYRAFGRGTLTFLHPENHKILVFIRQYENEIILVVANLSRFVQHVELNLSEFHGLVPVELFGRVEFPVIGNDPYPMMLGPHSFCWFALEAARSEDYGLTEGPAQEPVVVTMRGAWERWPLGGGKIALEKLLPDFLPRRRWFGGKNRKIRTVTVSDAIPIPHGDSLTHLILVNVEYLETDPDVYVLPVSLARGDAAVRIRKETPHAVMATTRGDDPAVIYDGMLNPNFCSTLLDAMRQQRSFAGTAGSIRAVVTDRLTEPTENDSEEPSLTKGEQSNSSVIFGDRYILKLFRRVEEGENPDLEISRFLTTDHRFEQTPSLAGSLEYRQGKRPAMTVGMLQEFVPNQGTVWQFTLDAIGEYCERILTRSEPMEEELLPSVGLLELSAKPIPDVASDVVAGYMETARLLGQRTAEMHIALASGEDDPAFRPEGFTVLFQRSIYQTMRSNASQVFSTLNKRLKKLPEAVKGEAEQVLQAQPLIFSAYRRVIEAKIEATRIRTHGDYHLGQVLYTGKDFVIIDFEGEPTRSVSDRRLKRSPLRDVAGMLRSFHYAAFTALGTGGAAMVREEDRDTIEPWLGIWNLWVSVAYLSAYFEVAEGQGFIPNDPRERGILLDAFLLEKAVYEIGYELGHRPAWLRVPLRGILDLVRKDEAATS